MTEDIDIKYCPIAQEVCKGGSVNGTVCQFWHVNKVSSGKPVGRYSCGLMEVVFANVKKGT